MIRQQELTFVGVAPTLVGIGLVIVVCGFVTPGIPVVEVAVRGTLPGRIIFACFITSVPGTGPFPV